MPPFWRDEEHLARTKCAIFIPEVYLVESWSSAHTKNISSRSLDLDIK
jgi:hypothetical protein